MNALLDLAVHAVLWLDPQGGQERARRNAWRAMVEDHARGRARHEANEAIVRAEVTAASREDQAPAW